MRLFLPPLRAAIFVLTALLGLIMGSFLDCLAWRLAHGESILWGRSHCAACGHTLSPRDLVPLASWFLLGGRCRYCGQPIPVRCLVSEVGTAAVYLSLVLLYGVSLSALRLLVLASLLVAAALVDLDQDWIPDQLIVAGIAAFAVFSLLDPLPFQTLFHGLLGSLALSTALLLLVLAADRILGRESMGGGDLKLFFMTGLYFHWKYDLLLLILTCILGLALAALMGRAKPGVPFPLAPALAAAAWLVMLAGRPVLHWYLGLFGLAGAGSNIAF